MANVIVVVPSEIPTAAMLVNWNRN